MKKIRAFVVFLILYLLAVGIVSFPAAIILWLLNKVLSIGISFIIWYLLSFIWYLIPIGVLIVAIEIYDDTASV